MSRAPAFGGSRPATAGKAVRSVADDGGLEVALGEAREAVLERDRLALLRQLQAAVDRTRGLGEDACVRRSAAPAGRAAAAVEDRQLDITVGGDARQLLLRAVDLPLRGEIAAVLARVGVAHHHLEAAAGTAIEDLLDEGAGSAEVGDRLEQRHALRARLRLRERAPPRRARRLPCGSSRRSGGRRPACRAAACAVAAAASVARMRSSGAWIAEACTRRSSFAR